MTKYLSGLTTAFLSMLLGAWLMASPFSVGGQSGGDWSGQTQVEFWTGLAVLLVAVAAQIAYGMGLAQDLRDRGLVQPRAAAPAEAAPMPAPDPEPRLEDLLAPLITALQRDLHPQDDAPRQPAQTQPQMQARPLTPAAGAAPHTDRRNL